MLVSNLKVKTLKPKVSGERPGFLIFGQFDTSLDTTFEVNLASLSVTGGLPGRIKSCVFNNTLNPDSITVTFDNVLKFPNEIAGGQIRTFELPDLDEPSDIIFTTTQAGSSTLCYFYLYSERLNPDSTGGTGTVVTVANTVPVTVSNNITVGALPSVTVGALPAIGVQGNAWNAALVSAGGKSNAISLGNTKKISVFGNANAATTLTIQFSQDNVNFYSSQYTIAANGDFGLSLDCAAAYMKILSSAAATITATVAGKG